MAVTQFTGIQGALTIAGSTFAIAEVDVKFDRAVLEHERSGSWSKLKTAGQVDFTGSLKRIQINGDLVQKMLNATPVSGSAVALHAGLTAGVADGETITDMTDPAALSSRVRATVLTAAVTVAGRITLIGTDVNDAYHSEILTIPVGSINDTITSTTVFKTVEEATQSDVVNTGGTIKLDAIVGSATTTIGAPEYWTLVATVTSGSDSITLTVTNCFFTSAVYMFGTEMLSDELEFTTTDAAANISWVGVET